MRCAQGAEDDHKYAMFTYVLESINEMGLAYGEQGSVHNMRCKSCYLSVLFLLHVVPTECAVCGSRLHHLTCMCQFQRFF